MTHVYIVHTAGYDDTFAHRTLEGAIQCLEDALESNGGETSSDCYAEARTLDVHARDRGRWLANFGWFPDGERGTIEICKLED